MNLLPSVKNKSKQEITSDIWVVVQLLFIYMMWLRSIINMDFTLITKFEWFHSHTSTQFQMYSHLSSPLSSYECLMGFEWHCQSMWISVTYHHLSPDKWAVCQPLHNQQHIEVSSINTTFVISFTTIYS